MMPPFSQISQRLRNSCNVATANVSATARFPSSRRRTRGRSDVTTKRRSIKEQMRRARGRREQTISFDRVGVKSAVTAGAGGVISGKECKPAAGRVQKRASCDVNGEIEHIAEETEAVPALNDTVSSKPVLFISQTRYKRRTCAGLHVLRSPSRDVLAKKKETSARGDSSSSKASNSALSVTSCSDKSVARSRKVDAVFLSGEDSSTERRRLRSGAVKHSIRDRGKYAEPKLLVESETERHVGPVGQEREENKDEVENCEHIINKQQSKQDDIQVFQTTGKEEPLEQHFAETLLSQEENDQKQRQGNRSAEENAQADLISTACENTHFHAEETLDSCRTRRHSDGAGTCSQKRSLEEFLLRQLLKTDEESCKVVSIEENSYKLRKKHDVVKSESFPNKDLTMVCHPQMKESENCKLPSNRQAHNYCDTVREEQSTSVSHQKKSTGTEKAILECLISTETATGAALGPQLAEKNFSEGQREKARHFIPGEVSLSGRTLFGAYRTDNDRPPRGAEKATEAQWRVIDKLKSQDLQAVARNVDFLQDDVRAQPYNNIELIPQESSSLRLCRESRQQQLIGEVNQHNRQISQLLHHSQTQQQLQRLEQHFEMVQRQQQEKSQLDAQNVRHQLQAEGIRLQHQTDPLQQQQQQRPSEQSPRHGSSGENDYSASGRVKFFLELPCIGENGNPRRRGVLVSKNFLRTGWRLQKFLGKLFQIDPEALLGLEDEQGFLSPFDGEELALQHGGTYTIVLAPRAGATVDSEKLSPCSRRESGDSDAAAAVSTHSEEITCRQRPALDTHVDSWEAAAAANRATAARGTITIANSPITYGRTSSVGSAEKHQFRYLLKGVARQETIASAALSGTLTGIAPASDPAAESVEIYEGAAAAASSQVGKNNMTFSNHFSTRLFRRNDVTVRLSNTVARKQNFAAPGCVGAAGLRSARQIAETEANENWKVEIPSPSLEAQLTNNNIAFCRDGRQTQQSRQKFAAQTLEEAIENLPRCETVRAPLSEKERKAPFEALRRELFPQHHSRPQQNNTWLTTHCLPVGKADTQQHIALSEEHWQQQQQRELTDKKKTSTQESTAQCKRIREKQRSQEWSQNEQGETMGRNENRKLGKLWVSSSHGGVKKKQLSSSATNNKLHDPEEVARRQQIAEQHVRAVLARVSLKKALQENLQKNGSYGMNLRRREYEQKEFFTKQAAAGLENKKQPTSPGGPLFLLPLKSAFQKNCTRPTCILTTAAGKTNATEPLNLPRIMDSDAATLLQRLLGGGTAAAEKDKLSSSVYTSQKAKDLLNRSGKTIAEPLCHEDFFALPPAAESGRRPEKRKNLQMCLELQGQQQHTSKSSFFICTDKYSGSALPQRSHIDKQLLHLASCMSENLEKERTNKISTFKDISNVIAAPAADTVRLNSCGLDPSFAGRSNRAAPSVISRDSLTASASSSSFPSEQKLPSTFHWNVAATSARRICFSENGGTTKGSCKDSVSEVATKPVSNSVEAPQQREQLIHDSLLEKLLTQLTWQDLQQLLSESSGREVERTANLRASSLTSEECSSETTESAIPAEQLSSVESNDHLDFTTAVTSCDERERSSSTKTIISGDTTAGGVDSDSPPQANEKEIQVSEKD